MKGLDGIQGPIYVGTGCVFRRQALYGYDAPKKAKSPGKTCNCWPKLCCCFGSRKKTKKVKSKNSKKKTKGMEASLTQIHALDNIEEGIEGKGTNILIVRFFLFFNIFSSFVWQELTMRSQPSCLK